MTLYGRGSNGGLVVVFEPLCVVHQNSISVSACLLRVVLVHSSEFHCLVQENTCFFISNRNFENRLGICLFRLKIRLHYAYSLKILLGVCL